MHVHESILTCIHMLTNMYRHVYVYGADISHDEYEELALKVSIYIHIYLYLQIYVHIHINIHLSVMYILLYMCISLSRYIKVFVLDFCILLEREILQLFLFLSLSILKREKRFTKICSSVGIVGFLIYHSALGRLKYAKKK
jgi:hypothetical protein